MSGVSRTLRHGKNRGAGDAHPAPRAAWGEEGGEGVGGAYMGSRKRPRRDKEGEADTKYRYSSAACAAAGTRWRSSRAYFSGSRASQRRKRRSARAKDALRLGNGGGRRGAGGGLCAHTRHAADPRAGDTIGPPKGAPATEGGPMAAGLRPSTQRENESGEGTRAAPHQMPHLHAFVGGRRRGPRPYWPARGQKTSSARGGKATGPPTRCLTWQVTACWPPRTAHAGRRVSADSSM